MKKNYNYKENPVNIGLDFAFDSKISMKVLKNYLSRSLTFEFLYKSVLGIEADISTIIDIGAKYIGRNVTGWIPSKEEVNKFPIYKKVIEKAHKIDPDIIFEACIFETTFTEINEIEIPAYVFDEYDLDFEMRNFSYEKMLYSDHRYLNLWREGGSVPDITSLETQMFFFYRACEFIKCGYEAIHWGQVHLMGENDKNFECFTDILNRTRKYAKIHSRRHFVLMNAHTHGIIGSDGKLLFDFHAYPIRCRCKKDAVEHISTVENPQQIVIDPAHVDSLICHSAGGLTHSGWECDSLPYFVEIDNYGGTKSGMESVNKPLFDYWPWGYDECSWLANQPRAYRHEWISYAYEKVRELDDNGYLEMLGSRPITIFNKIDEQLLTDEWYCFNIEKYDDVQAIKNVWIYNKKHENSKNDNA